MEQFLQDWGYLGIFLGIIATGAGFPMPEELPVVIGGGLVASHPDIYWYIMLPVCIVAVIIGDSFLYAIGRIWGAKLVERPFVQKHLLKPEKLEKIRKNFKKYGIRILLFARMTPGIRAPIFLTAGITHLPLGRFLLADGIYAVPGVSLLFYLGYLFTDQVVSFFKEDAEIIKRIIIGLVVLVAVGYFLWKSMRVPVTGDPKEVPKLVEPIEKPLDSVTVKIIQHQENKQAAANGAETKSDAKQSETPGHGL